ncbi:MAG TPA: biotin/lipoyl-binding protein [Candidatus Aminicenantes bacterium]|nr:biotin/lipoyl-binding protein [Candidatus Aminicenantes bacterium]
MMNFEFVVDGQTCLLSVEKLAKGWQINIAGEKVVVDDWWVSEQEISLIIDGRSYVVAVVPQEESYLCWVQGEIWSISKPQQDAEFGGVEQDSSLEDKLKIKAPMPGKVIKLNVQEGDPVRENQTLAVVEAMKMENEIKSTVAGLVKKVLIKVGDLVENDKVLIELGIED